MSRAASLSVMFVLVAICLGCGDRVEQQLAPLPESKQPVIPPTADPPQADDAQDSASVSTGTDEGGPGTGSEFNVPPNLGVAPPDATAPADVESEFKLPPVADN